METLEFIECLSTEGKLLAAAAEQAGPDAEVPPCPGWRVRDLVRHQGLVHRWAAGFVVGGLTSPAAFPDDRPDDGALAAWFRAGHLRLVEGLGSAPVDLDCWYFLPAPSPRAFWARRQAHETAIHRVDAEAALGTGISPIGAEFAADGVDELLAGFHVREKSRVRSERPRTLRIRTVDVPGDWLVRISPDPPRVERAGDDGFGDGFGDRDGDRDGDGDADGDGEADCTVAGAAAELYLALWNRGTYEGLTVSGDASLVDLWRGTSAV